MSDLRHELEQINDKLERLDKAIRGNGTPGINQRLDRLEQIEAGRKRLFWIVLVAMVGSLAPSVVQAFSALSGK